SVAIHFDINNNPNTFMDKNIVLFLFPVGMTLMQIVCCVATDLKKDDNHYTPKIEYICKSIVPVMSIFMYSLTLIIALGTKVDVRLFVCFFLSIIFIVTGNYLPKTASQYLQSLLTISHPSSQRKVTRLMGYSFVIFGLLLLISLFFSPIYSVLVVALIIIVLLVEAIYFYILIHKSKV
ncbi:MAG: DUF1648 domain-containing protein, partial [Coprobacillus sp.]